MRIHYQDTLVAYYPTEIIGSIKFEKDSTTRDILNVYIFSYPKSYILSSIDSVIFYIDQYQPLTIGSQVWMLKNLNVDHYRNGDSIPEVQDATAWIWSKTGALCYYGNVPTMGAIYGKLYNWYTVIDIRGLAPTGWHVPSDAEWTILTTFLGGEDVAGGKVKDTSTNYWTSLNVGATNESGFSALPGGLRFEYSSFYGIGSGGYWWSSTKYNNTAGAWYRFLRYDSTIMGRSGGIEGMGLSVRCIRDK
jgi:uncharacterized protein (TIGR02145 family)